MGKSRTVWKTKAVRRATKLRDQRKTITRLRDRFSSCHLELEHSVRRLEAENTILRACALTPSAQIIDLNAFANLRTLCVMMVIVGIVSFRSVPRILNLLGSSSIAASDSPHFTSVINWVLRAGVAVFDKVSGIVEPWLAIIDCSIDVGTRKALVVLRVRLAALAEKQGAIGLADCECIGIKISTRWNGPLVKDALSDIFGKAGMPRAILKDRGTDIGKGVQLFRETQGAKKIAVIDDVGHIAANALKAEFGGRRAFAKFLDIVRKGSARIRQTDLARFLPPKIRTKGRFQGITKVAVWAEKILGLMSGQGRSKNNSERDLLRKAFCGLPLLRRFLEKFGATCRVTERFLKVMKEKGLNQATYAEAKGIVIQLPKISKVRASLLAWLEKHLHLQCRLGIGQMALAVSSDAIESLFGKFKTIIQRNPQAELNRLVYIIPLLCGNHTSESIDRALKDCSHMRMLERIGESIPPTLRQQRHRVLDMASSAVPETGNPLRLKAG